MQKPSSRPNFHMAIADFAAGMKKFQPVLVNEKFTGQYEPKPGEKAPTLDEFITLGGAMMICLSDFLGIHKQLEAKYGELYADAMIVHVRCKEIGVSAQSLEDLFQKFLDRHQQALSAMNAAKERNDLTPIISYIDNLNKRIEDAQKVNGHENPPIIPFSPQGDSEPQS